MKRRRVHLLYEYGPDSGPFGSAYIRLLRPFTHPSLREMLDISAGPNYDGQAVDAVIVDRLWRPDISPARASDLVNNVRGAGARLIYALDDDLLGVPAETLVQTSQNSASSPEEKKWVVKHLLQQSEGVLVTTPALQQRFSGLNPNIAVIPQALDERLLVGREPADGRSPFGPRKKVVGCMGTFTHDDDLAMILPALRAVSERHPRAIEFQILGVAGREETLDALRALPARFLAPRPEEHAYPLFMLWYSSQIRWDIALAPLRDTPFNHCKSDIKCLDYSAVGAAGIYSRVPAYESTVRHGETGLLVGEEVEAWEDALESLLEDDDLRKQLARNATKYLATQRTLAHSAENWLLALEEVLENA